MHLARLEEVRIVQENVDDFKRLYEGAPMKVDIKYKGPKAISRTPVFCSSNSHPWRWVMDEQQALMNRMEFFEFKEYPGLENMSGHLNPLSWLYLMEQMGVSDDYGFSPILDEPNATKRSIKRALDEEDEEDDNPIKVARVESVEESMVVNETVDLSPSMESWAYNHGPRTKASV